MRSTEVKVIENLINNALETQYKYIQDENFSEMGECDATEYAGNTSKIIELEETIQSLITEDIYKIFLELDSLTMRNASIESQYMFKKGVIEGLTTFEYLKEVSNCVYLPLMKI